MNIEIYDSEYEYLFNNNAHLECLFSDAIWAEGPVWIPTERAVIFSDVKGNCMYKWSQDSNTTAIFRQPSDFANGNALLNDERLVSCQHGARGISITTRNEVQLLTGHYNNKRFNSPNDLIVRSDNTIWFTDPPYGILSDNEGYKSASEIIGCYIYCYSPQTDKVVLATFNTMRPNGLHFSPDESKLYVAEMSIVEFEDGLHHLVVFDVDGYQLKNRRVLCEINPGIPDGFCLDEQELIYCSCDDGILVITPTGKTVAKIIIGKTVSNCTLGGTQQNELFITASNSLYKIKLNTKGFQYNAFYK